MTTLSPEEMFFHLFRGRTDAYGQVHGQCIREDVTFELFEAHLSRPDKSLGIYPMAQTPEGGFVVGWGCSDVDDGFEKSLPLAINLWKVLRKLGITSWVERTKGKGYHVWVFVSNWVEASAMRNCLLFAHQIAGVRPTEVNPKQVDLSGGKLGNYVNLPYAKDWHGSGKRAVLDVRDSNDPRAMDWAPWTKVAWETRNTPGQIRRVAELYVPPPPPKAVHIARPVGPAERSQLSDKLDGLSFAIWRDGPLDGRDRSTTLARLAHLMRERTTLTAGEACDLLYDADYRWGKYHERGDTSRLDDIIRRAYG